MWGCCWVLQTSLQFTSGPITPQYSRSCPSVATFACLSRSTFRTEAWRSHSTHHTSPQVVYIARFSRYPFAAFVVVLRLSNLQCLGLQRVYNLGGRRGHLSPCHPSRLRTIGQRVIVLNFNHLNFGQTIEEKYRQHMIREAPPRHGPM